MFAPIDWIILAVYLLAVVGVGIRAARGGGPGSDEPFLAGRSMPMWAVAISVVATSLSAATFIGGPAESYGGDLRYFSANLGGLVAMVVVAMLFVPAFYRIGATSVYEVLGAAWGPLPRRAASVAFLGGRLLASGARLFMVAIPFALVAFGRLDDAALATAILVIAAVAAGYTVLGGIRAVIWTDVLQAAVVVGTVLLALGILAARIPVDAGTIVSALAEEGRLRILDLSTDPARPYTLWTAGIGFTLFFVAAYGTDQDLAQRLLTCRTARGGARSMILAQVLAWPVVALFLVLGLLLHVFYDRPDLMGAAAPATTIDDPRRVFLDFILNEMPIGARGLVMSGLFAAAMSSMDSALNAMAAATLSDLDPVGRRGDDPARLRRRARGWSILWAVALAGVAILCIGWQRASGRSLITFALGVMIYAYSGLLAVFLAALATRRGTARSAVAALIVGPVVVALTETGVLDRWSAALLDRPIRLAFPWRMTIATALAFAVCVAPRGARPRRGLPVTPDADPGAGAPAPR